MPDYKNAKIYKLWSPEGDDIYIGSTTQKLCVRKAKHKATQQCTSKILYEKYTDIRIELLECFPCDNKEELTKKEGEYIRNTNCINRYIAGRTQKEYYKNNKKNIKEYKKEYYETNKAHRKEQMKEWYETNKTKIKERKSQKYTCECGRTFRTGNKARHERSNYHSKFVGNGVSEPDIP